MKKIISAIMSLITILSLTTSCSAAEVTEDQPAVTKYFYAHNANRKPEYDGKRRGKTD